MLDRLPVDWGIRTLTSGARFTERIDKHPVKRIRLGKASRRPSDERFAWN